MNEHDLTVGRAADYLRVDDATLQRWILGVTVPRKIDRDSAIMAIIAYPAVRLNEAT